MGNTRKASKAVFTIFTVILSISMIFNMSRLIQSVSYYEQCQPHFVAVSQVDYDEANYFHLGALKNPVDENSKEAKEALKTTKEKMKSSDWYKEKVQKSADYVVMSSVSTGLAVLALIVEITVYANNKFQTNKSKVVIAIVAVVAIATFVYAVYTIPAIDYIQKFSNPLIPYVVPVD